MVCANGNPKILCSEDVPRKSPKNPQNPGTFGVIFHEDPSMQEPFLGAVEGLITNSCRYLIYMAQGEWHYFNSAIYQVRLHRDQISSLGRLLLGMGLPSVVAAFSLPESELFPLGPVSSPLEGLLRSNGSLWLLMLVLLRFSL